MTGNLIKEISAGTLIGQSDLMRIAVSAPARYKVYGIPKRQGGTRVIAQPSRELKIIQRYIIDGVLSKLPVHRAALAYVDGKNIADNASLHRRSSCILKLDFKDFFPSIRVKDWESYAKHNLPEMDQNDVRLLSYLMFWGKGSQEPKVLSIGAPTSPMLSNILCFTLDRRLNEAAHAEKVKYTRYADDITASAANVERLLGFEKAARAIVKKMQSPKFSFNEDKRGVYTLGQRRMVTGLVITPEKKISMGRDRKRLVSAMLHNFVNETLPEAKIPVLRGYVSFANAVEPDFLRRMEEKYGTHVFAKLKRQS